MCRCISSAGRPISRTASNCSSVFAGLHDVSTRWFVTHDFAQWKDEIAWMSLYFSAAVWSSLALCAFGLVADRLHHYRRECAEIARLPAPRLLLEQRR